MNFVVKNFAIPVSIGLLTLFITERQQDSASIVANRQKLAEALSLVGKVQADYHLADMQIAFLASAGSRMISTKDLKDAVLRLDNAIASFGAQLGPFEEFARRTRYYDIKPHDPSPLQAVWDNCFVKPYWGFDKTYGYLDRIKSELAKCDGADCPREVAQSIRAQYDSFYQGYCANGQPAKQVPEIWFNRELKRISIQEPHVGSVYDVGIQ